MKNRSFFVVAAIALTLLMTSCTTLSGLTAITDGTSISSANFSYVKSVKEESKAVYVLGFGGGNAARKALDNLKENTPLEPGQVLTNYTVTEKTSFVVFGLFIVKEVTVEADVIQFK